MMQDLSGSWCIKRTDESVTRVDSSVPLTDHDPDKSWITDPDLDSLQRNAPFNGMEKQNVVNAERSGNESTVVYFHPSSLAVICYKTKLDIYLHDGNQIKQFL